MKKFMPQKFRNTRITFAVVLAFSILPMKANAILISTLEDFTNGGGYFGEITVADSAADTVAIYANIAITDVPSGTLQEGDILGLWFGLNDYDAANTYTYSNMSGGPVTDFATGDPVSINLGMGNNLNGGTPGVDGLFNIAFTIGSNGGSGGLIASTNFSISGVNDFGTYSLSEASFANEYVGMRVQSTSGENFTTGSSKLVGGYTPTPPTEVPEPGSLALLGVGLLGFAGSAMRRRRRD